MKFQKRHIITVLFSIYFALYVLSPICYTEDGLYDSSAIAYQKDPGGKNIRVIWELILSKHLAGKTAESSKPNVKLLIRKARTLISSGDVVKLKPSEYAVFDYNDIIFSLKSCRSSDHYTKPEYRTGSYLSVSGLSPPSFS